MSRLLHLSDTHFGTEQPAEVQALEDHVREHRADLLVFSGDITQRARTLLTLMEMAIADGGARQNLVRQ